MMSKGIREIQFLHAENTEMPLKGSIIADCVQLRWTFIITLIVFVLKKEVKGKNTSF